MLLLRPRLQCIEAERAAPCRVRNGACPASLVLLEELVDLAAPATSAALHRLVRNLVQLLLL
jgi:hypothetical protein